MTLLITGKKCVIAMNALASNGFICRSKPVICVSTHIIAHHHVPGMPGPWGATGHSAPWSFRTHLQEVSHPSSRRFALALNTRLFGAFRPSCIALNPPIEYMILTWVPAFSFIYEIVLSSDHLTEGNKNMLPTVFCLIIQLNFNQIC